MGLASILLKNFAHRIGRRAHFIFGTITVEKNSAYY